jgi:H+-transporting ATPase
MDKADRKTDDEKKSDSLEKQHAKKKSSTTTEKGLTKKSDTSNKKDQKKRSDTTNKGKQKKQSDVSGMEASEKSSNTSDKEKSESLDETKKMDINSLLKKLSSSKDGLSSKEAEKRLEQYGLNEITEKKKNPVLKFLGYFWGPIPWMIEVAAILSAFAQHWLDLGVITALLVFNALVGFWQEFQASNAVDALKKQLAINARVKRDGKWIDIASNKLVPGDIIRLRGGDIIPADTKLYEGDYLSVDQSALTGESLPVEKNPGDIGYSGSVAKQGEMAALVTKTGSDTYFGKTAKLVSKAKSVSHFQRAVLNIGDYLIYLSIGLAAALLLVMLFRGAGILTLIQFVLILIVAAIPVAMPAVLSVTMAVGAVNLAKMKAIVTRLESIEEMAGMDVLCSDKTGTLTQNKLTLGEPALFGEKDESALILAGALASKEENKDAIDTAVIAGLKDEKKLTSYAQTKFIPFDPVHKRTEATIKGPDGKTFHVTKGAPQVILEMCHPKKELADQVNKKVDEFAQEGYRTLGVAQSEDGKTWKFLGILPLFDPPREDSADTIKRAEEHGIQVKMVTGDNIAIAKQIAKKLGLGSNIHEAKEFFTGTAEQRHLSERAAKEVEDADGFAEVFPEHKFDIVEALQERDHIVGMTGDGVNDAPALKQANTGIAVSGATDAARAASALVLTAPGLSVIVHAVEQARKIFERMNSYAIYRITETIRIMFFVVLSMIVFDFYPITAIMIILLAFFNDIPIMSIARDNTWLDPKPVKWDMHRVLTVSTFLGLIGVVETFGLLVIARLYLHLDISQIQTLIFLKLAVAGHLTLFVARTKLRFFARPYPAPVVFWSAVGTKLAVTVLVAFGAGLVTPIPLNIIGLTWGYALAWIFIEDFAKLRIYHHLGFTSKHHKSFLDRVKTPLHPHAQ